MPARPRRPVWATWSNEQLLQLRIRDLRLSIRGSWLDPLVMELNYEFEQRGFLFRPHIWLSEEWFSPLSSPGFAIPFYLAHPRLMRLERSMMLDVEGGTSQECLQIMRHEAGHALQHAYRLQRRKRWQELFGKSSMKYPEFYRPNPASKRYVQHLRLWYAQAHPDEDFAETFAVWLKPKSDWRKRYASWPALRKLEYVDELIGEIAREKPVVASRATLDPLSRINKTLAQHYEDKRSLYSVQFPNIYDRDLLRLFSDAPEYRHREAASSFLRRHRAEIRRRVSRWSGEYEFTLETVLENMIGRCRELKLRVVGKDRDVLMDFTVLLTVKTMHYLYSRRRDWIAL